MRLRVLALPSDPTATAAPFVFILDDVPSHITARILGTSADVARDVDGCRGLLVFADAVDIPE